MALDVSQASAVQAAIAQTLAEFGRLDYAFNDAGVTGKVTSTVEQTEEDGDAVLNTNWKGVWLEVSDPRKTAAAQL